MNVVAIHEHNQIEWTEDKIKLLKNTICKGASDNELELFIHACKRSGLDPFMKQIHAVKRPTYNASTKSYEEQMSIQTGIDGYRLIAERTGRYAPGKAPTFQYDSNGNMISATAYVKKQTPDGTWHEISGEAFYEEYVARKKDGTPQSMWQKPHIMLAKCAEALALRKAFPADLSGLYTKEEMDQASNPRVEAIDETVEVRPTVDLEPLLEILPVDLDISKLDKYILNLAKKTKKTPEDLIAIARGKEENLQKFIEGYSLFLKA